MSLFWSEIAYFRSKLRLSMQIESIAILIVPVLLSTLLQFRFINFIIIMHLLLSQETFWFNHILKARRRLRWLIWIHYYLLRVELHFYANFGNGHREPPDVQINLIGMNQRRLSIEQERRMLRNLVKSQQRPLKDTR